MSTAVNSAVLATPLDDEVNAGGLVAPESTATPPVDETETPPANEELVETPRVGVGSGFGSTSKVPVSRSGIKRTRSGAPVIAATPKPRGSKSSIPGSHIFHNWEVGEQYRMVKILGHGSYGQVAEGYDKKHERKVAIKRINNVFDQEIDTKRILREVFILRHLQHENVVKLLNIVKPDREDFNELYLVFEYIDTDLNKLITSPQYLTIDHIKTFMHQLLCGLKYIHSTLVIHRDIKPANILLSEDCKLKICDFGLARVVSPSRFVGTAATTATNAAALAVAASPDARNSEADVEAGSAGLDSPKKLQRQLTKHVVTRWYRPPELILLQDYTNAVDMWSVGCIFAELLGMQKESVPSYKSRTPLFPGKSCFPLSADNDRTYKDQLDQLNVIFKVIGTPDEVDIKDLGDVQHYLRGLQTQKKVDFTKAFRAAPPSALRLLNRMLVFNPSKRISVDEALEHEFLSSARAVQSEVIAERGLTMGGHFFNLSKRELKQRLLEEVEHYKARNQ